MLFFHFCINFSSGFEPAFNRAASRNHTEGVCFESCHLDHLNSIQLIWMLFFHVCINFSSGFEPAFHRAASRSHTEGVCFESCHRGLMQQLLFPAYYFLCLNKFLQNLNLPFNHAVNRIHASAMSANLGIFPHRQHTKPMFFLIVIYRDVGKSGFFQKS